jgi:predicted HTH transcriptional regulator
VPTYKTRLIEHEGKQVLAVEVAAGGQMYAYRIDKTKNPDFYVRIGPNTSHARHQEIAAGFLQSQAGPRA